MRATPATADTRQLVDARYADNAVYRMQLAAADVIRTTEYWYLRWWSTVEHKYRYPYRETSRHTCILSNTSDEWLVEENIRPAPRSSSPHRQRK